MDMPRLTMSVAIFRNRQGAWRNVAALSYTLAGYALGVVLLTAQHWALNLVGVLLTGHTPGLRRLLHPRVRPPDRVSQSGGEQPLGHADELDRGQLLRAVLRAAPQAHAPSHRSRRRPHLRLQEVPERVARLGTQTGGGAGVAAHPGGRIRDARLRDAAAVPQARAQRGAAAPDRHRAGARGRVRAARLVLAQGAAAVCAWPT